MMRNGLSYAAASANCNRIANREYDECIASGCSERSAREAAREAYEAEMRWYESASTLPSHHQAQGE
jgi:hypothetical protein